MNGIVGLIVASSDDDARRVRGDGGASRSRHANNDHKKNKSATRKYDERRATRTSRRRRTHSSHLKTAKQQLSPLRCHRCGDDRSYKHIAPGGVVYQSAEEEAERDESKVNEVGVRF